MSLAFSCAGARLHGRVGAAKCGVATVSLVRRSSCFYPNARRWSTRGIRSELPLRSSAGGGGAATTSGAAVAMPEVGEVADSAKEVDAVTQPCVLPEKGGEVPDVDGSRGNGKFPPGGGAGDGDNGGGGGGDGDDEGEDEFGPILCFEQVVQEAESAGLACPACPRI